MICGLLGEKLGHSYSQQIHTLLANYEYKLFEVKPQDLKEFLFTGEYTGLNVTIPYKKAVIPYCDELSPIAAQLGAVNTIVRRSDGKLIGHNSDHFGFSSMLQRCGLNVNGKKALVLGSGGASVTAVSVLQQVGANVVVISRGGQNNYGNLHLHSDAAVIVNATPVGMYPHTGVSPVNTDLFPALEGVLDLIYNPARTQLLLDAEAKGCITENGLWMLVAQAKESAQWFAGKMISDEKISQIHQQLSRQMRNVVLVGMPGCGKSTIGKELANILGRKFVDADSRVAEKAGMSIPDIFQTYGEAEFRKLESEVLAELGKESSLVIATGGGCVTKEENYNHLHQNGHIYWVNRDIHCLPTDGRPLSKRGDLTAMFALREPLYRQFSDYRIDNNAEISSAVEQIKKMEGY